ncbi:hypothetical protein AAMO2058_000257700 [Amorphochlora amoebiformis]
MKWGVSNKEKAGHFKIRTWCTQPNPRKLKKLHLALYHLWACWRQEIRLRRWHLILGIVVVTVLSQNFKSASKISQASEASKESKESQASEALGHLPHSDSLQHLERPKHLEHLKHTEHMEHTEHTEHMDHTERMEHKDRPDRANRPDCADGGECQDRLGDNNPNDDRKRGVGTSLPHSSQSTKRGEPPMKSVKALNAHRRQGKPSSTSSGQMTQDRLDMEIACKRGLFSKTRPSLGLRKGIECESRQFLWADKHRELFLEGFDSLSLKNVKPIPPPPQPDDDWTPYEKIPIFFACYWNHDIDLHDCFYRETPAGNQIMRTQYDKDFRPSSQAALNPWGYSKEEHEWMSHLPRRMLGEDPRHVFLDGFHYIWDNYRKRPSLSRINPDDSITTYPVHLDGKNIPLFHFQGEVHALVSMNPVHVVKAVTSTRQPLQPYWMWEKVCEGQVNQDLVKQTEQRFPNPKYAKFSGGTSGWKLLTDKTATGNSSTFVGLGHVTIVSFDSSFNNTRHFPVFWKLRLATCSIQMKVLWDFFEKMSPHQGSRIADPVSIIAKERFSAYI